MNDIVLLSYFCFGLTFPFPKIPFPFMISAPVVLVLLCQKNKREGEIKANASGDMVYVYHLSHNCNFTGA